MLIASGFCKMQVVGRWIQSMLQCFTLWETKPSVKRLKNCGWMAQGSRHCGVLILHTQICGVSQAFSQFFCHTALTGQGCR